MKDAGNKRVSRRLILKGMGGTTLALPFLESLVLKSAFGQSEAAEPFVIFLRQANGVAQEQNSPNELGHEPDRFWPHEFGPLTPENVAGRAMDELEPHLARLLAVANVNYNWFEYGDGHAMGAMQALTGRGPVVERAGNGAEAAGESLDHRIGRELNPGGRDSLFLYAGRNDGWLGGACISYRDSGQRRNPLHNPWNAYQHIVGGSGGLSPEVAARIAERRESVNDVLRGQLERIRNHRRLGSSDRQRLDLHLQAIREVEVAVGCRMAEDRERILSNEAPGYDSTNGDEVLSTARLHIDIAVLAVACGYTRSVAIQVGNGNDGHSRYRDPDTGALMENYHYISHRRMSHGIDGALIPDSDVLHHKVDRQFAATFRYLIDRMEAFDTGSGRLLDQGLAVWYNDNSNGPPHGIWNVPWILAGSAGGYFRQGEYVRINAHHLDVTHTRLLNTIGTAMGVKNASGGPLDDFGDPSLPTGTLDELKA